MISSVSDLSFNYLSLIHPDDATSQCITPVSNTSPYLAFKLLNSDYISPEDIDSNDEMCDTYFEKEIINLCPPPPTSPEPIEIYKKEIYNNFLNVTNHAFKNKIGDGKMEYIKDKLNREMFVNAWKAITITNNWDFMAQQIESFAFSSDPRIYDITKKMEQLGYNGHSGTTFGATMRSMQYLVIYGEEEFKKLF